MRKHQQSVADERAQHTSCACFVLMCQQGRFYKSASSNCMHGLCSHRTDHSCPKLVPGLISAAPGKKNAALQTAAQQVEAMVKHKMQQREYIIMCLEDTSDWNNATTRKIVMQVFWQLLCASPAAPASLFRPSQQQSSDTLQFAYNSNVYAKAVVLYVLQC